MTLSLLKLSDFWLSLLLQMMFTRFLSVGRFENSVFLSSFQFKKRRHMSLSLQGGTDNKANESLSKKRSSTKWPLMLVSMQLSHLSMEAGLKVSLKWRPRDENEPADALTNGDFTGFDHLKRISIAWGDVDWSLLNSLWEERAEFLDRESWKTFGEGESTGRFEKSKWS